MLSTALLAALPLIVSTPSEELAWVHSFEDAKAQAESRGSMILIYCWSEGSSYCSQLYGETLSDEKAQKAMAPFVCYSAKHGKDGVQEVFDRYGVTSMPTLLFLDPQGNAEDSIFGFIPAVDFIPELSRIHRGENTVTDLRKKAKAAKEGSDEQVEAMWLLAGKIQALGDGEGHDELMAKIRELDPKGATEVGARLLLNEVTLSCLKGSDEEDPQSWDLEPLYTFVKKSKSDVVRFDAWNQIGNMEFKRENAQAAFEAFHAAFKVAPEQRLVEWANGMARWMVENPEGRTSKDKKFALQIVNAAVKQLGGQVAKAAKEGQKDVGFEDKMAYTLNTLAWTYHLNGNKRKAMTYAKRCVELRDTEDYRRDLEKLAKAD